MTTTRVSGQRYQANILAHDTLDIVAAKGFEQIQLGPLDVTGFDVVQPYSLEGKVEAVAGYSDEFLKRIKVIVSWKHRNQVRTVTQELDVQPARP